MHSTNILRFVSVWISLLFSTVRSSELVDCSTSNDENNEIHFGHLDVRVGRISHVDVHINDLTHFHKKVNFNGSLQLTCVSQIATFLKVQDFRNRLCLFIVNVKPLKILGVESQAMILTTEIDEWWLNVIDPPEGSVAGDIVYVEGYKYQPLPEIDVHTKNFRKLMSHMRVNDDGITTYKGIPLNVSGKGPAITENLIDIGLRATF